MVPTALFGRKQRHKHISVKTVFLERAPDRVLAVTGTAHGSAPESARPVAEAAGARRSRGAAGRN